MDQFEAFASRFARMSDMLIQKVLELTPYLLDCTEKIRAYCKKRNYVSDKE